MPSLILLPGDNLHGIYERAFREARELYIVSAYLTAWDVDLELNAQCKFRLIVGQDFGITRKDACQSVLNWLPRNQKQNFYVASYIGGFHPKAMLWRDKQGKRHLLVGSSNLTEAAFDRNYEANFYSSVSTQTYEKAVRWIDDVIKKSQIVGPKWFKTYEEAELSRTSGKRTIRPLPQDLDEDFPLPDAEDDRAIVMLKERRKQVKAFEEIRKPLRRILKSGAEKQLSSVEICNAIFEIWEYHRSRFQGKGWERTGVNSDWQIFAQGIDEILKSRGDTRDDVVSTIIDRFAEEKLPTRKAVLSEMICQFFPDTYPVLNGPVRLWAKKMNYHAPRGASEGAKFIDLSIKMRATVANNKNGESVRVRNLAELDALIWANYGDEYQKKVRGKR